MRNSEIKKKIREKAQNVIGGLTRHGEIKIYHANKARNWKDNQCCEVCPINAGKRRKLLLAGKDGLSEKERKSVQVKKSEK